LIGLTRYTFLEEIGSLYFWWCDAELCCEGRIENTTQDGASIGVWGNIDDDAERTANLC
jgi:hypothetical protein